MDCAEHSSIVDTRPGALNQVSQRNHTIPVRGSIGTAPMIYFVFKHVIFNNLKPLEAVLVL